jgi:hypothetical protein
MIVPDKAVVGFEPSTTAVPLNAVHELPLSDPSSSMVTAETPVDVHDSAKPLQIGLTVLFGLEGPATATLTEPFHVQAGGC